MPERKEGVVPRLRFPEFRNTGPWEEKRLGEICDVLQGYGFPEKFQGKKNGKYPFCKVSDITYAVNKTGGAIARAENYVDDEDIEALRARLVPIGATVFAKIGEALRLNKRALVSVECLIDNNVVGLRGRDNQTKDRFVFYLSQKIDLNEYCGGAVPAVNKSTLESIKLFVPEIEEQQKIADCLSSLDEVIELEAKKLEALKTHKIGLMQQLFPCEGETTPRLRFPEFRDAGEWEEIELGSIGNVSMCKRVMKHETSEKGDVPFYKIGTFGKNADAFIDKELYEIYKSKYPYPKKGDILISASGTIGRLVVYNGQPAYFQDSNIVWVDNDERVVVNSFLYYCYGGINWKTDDNTISRLYNDNIRKLKILKPSFLEQQKIADCLSSLDEAIELEAQKLETLMTHKKGLMQRLFPQEVD